MNHLSHIRYCTLSPRVRYVHPGGGHLVLTYAIPLPLDRTSPRNYSITRAAAPMECRIPRSLSIIIIAHNFWLFGPPVVIKGWDGLVSTFNWHRYEVTGTKNKKFVGIHIYHYERFKQYLDQQPMITSIIEVANITGDRDEHILCFRY